LSSSDYLQVEHRAARGDRPQRLDELIVAEHPVLEQVADAARSVGQQLAGVELLDVLGEHKDRQPRQPPPGFERGPQSLVGERRRQPDVDDRDVGPVGEQRAEQFMRRRISSPAADPPPDRPPAALR